MSNLIDRDKLIELIKELKKIGTDFYEGDLERQQGFAHAIRTVIQCTEDQPTVKEWIPVSERLPEEGENVFAVIGNEEQYAIDKATYICEGVWLKDMLNFDPNEAVLAWIPIPSYRRDE